VGGIQAVNEVRQDAGQLITHGDVIRGLEHSEPQPAKQLGVLRHTGLSELSMEGRQAGGRLPHHRQVAGDDGLDGFIDFLKGVVGAGLNEPFMNGDPLHPFVQRRQRPILNPEIGEYRFMASSRAIASQTC